MTSENIDAQARRVEQDLLDKTQRWTSELWSALLVVEGALVTIFTGLGLFSEAQRPLVVALVASSLLSVGLLVLNFRGIRGMYRWMGKVGVEGMGSRSEAQQREDIDEALTLKKRCDQRENAVLLLLLMQAAMILALLLPVEPFSIEQRTASARQENSEPTK